MPWYNAGTASVTNNSTAITGAGTAWADFVNAGQAFIGPDGLTYEIASVVSATAITLARPYRGATAAGQAYAIVPVQGYLRDLAIKAAELVQSFATVRDGPGAGIFPVGSVGTPGVRFAGDEDTGLYRIGANILGLATAGIERMRIDGSGRFGFGVSSITTGYIADFGGAAKLTGDNAVYSMTTANGRGWRIGHTSVGTTHGYFYLQGTTDNFAASFIDGLFVSTNGNVGMGTPAPGAKAHILASGRALAIEGGGALYQGMSIQTNYGSASQNAVLYTDFKNENGITTASIFSDVFADGSADIGISATAPGSRTADRRVTVLRVNHAQIFPDYDNGVTNGLASRRWSGGNIATAWTVTSDLREKHWHGFPADLKTKIRRIAEKIVASLGWWQFLKEMGEKGEDGARWHFGAGAQAVWSFVAEEGLCAPLVGEGAEQCPDPEWTGGPPPAFLCWDKWEEQREPIVEERQVDTETVVIDRVETGLLNADGSPHFRDVTEDRPVLAMVDTGETRLVQAAGNRFGLRLDQMGLLLDWAQSERDKEKGALIADLSARLGALEAA